MMNTSDLPRHTWMRVLAPIAAVTLVAAALGPVVAEAAAVAGDTYVYRVSNGYTKEVRGQISYRIDRVDADRTVVSVTPDGPALGQAYTVVYTNEGNWLRHPVTNHDQPVEYEFAQPHPAYLFPLDEGRSWSVRVDAAATASERHASVLVDGTVLGAERIRVLAGVFDTIKIRRLVYAGDRDFFRKETNIMETEWYAPALGRAVRSESKSEYLEPTRHRAFVQLGEWNVHELAAFNPAPRP